MSRPLVFAHRGASAGLPEHTLAAYQRAIEQGVDGLECDVRLTRDGHLVCHHDRRLERTSNGQGLVSAASLADLERLDFSSWHDSAPHDSAPHDLAPHDLAPHDLAPHDLAPRDLAPQDPHDAAPAMGVLTLDRLLRLVRDAGRPLHLLIETKHPSRFGGEVERGLAALLTRHGMAGDDDAAPVQVSVMSFSPLAIRRIHGLTPALPTVFLFELAPPGVREGRPPFAAGLLGPGVRALRARPELVRRAHERDRQVYVWTVNEPDDLDFVLALGVDGIISDRPAYVLSRLAG